MIITIELPPEIMQLAQAKADARGVPLEKYLSDLVTQALQQEEWDAAVPDVPTDSFRNAAA